MKGLVQRFHNYAEWLTVCGRWYFALKINYLIWRKYAFYFLLFALILTSLVFVPGIGFSHVGATRWLDLGLISFQPVEVLKIAFNKTVSNRKK